MIIEFTDYFSTLEEKAVNKLVNSIYTVNLSIGSELKTRKSQWYIKNLSDISKALILYQIE